MALALPTDLTPWPIKPYPQNPPPVLHRAFDWDDAEEDKHDDEDTPRRVDHGDDWFTLPDPPEADDRAASAAEDRWISDRDRTASQ